MRWWDLPEHRHWLAELTQNPARGNDQPIVNTLHIDPLLSSLSDRSDVSPELVDLVFDIGEYASGAQFREHLRDEAAGDREPFLIRYNMQWDVELVKFSLRVQVSDLCVSCAGIALPLGT